MLALPQQNIRKYISQLHELARYCEPLTQPLPFI